MNRQLSPRRALFLVAGCLLAGCQNGTPRVEAPVTNEIVLVTVEGLGANDIGCQGNPAARTPHLDRWARRGLSAAAVAGAAQPRVGLATILTGRPPTEHELTDSEFAVRNDVPLVSEILRDLGAETACFAGTPAADQRHGLGQGFARHATPFERFDRVLEPVRAYPLAPTADLLRAYEEWRRDTDDATRFAWFHGAKRPSFDRDFAHVLRALDENAFVVFTSPQAADGTNVPWIVRGPHAPAGARTQATHLAQTAKVLAAAFGGETLVRRTLASAGESTPAAADGPAANGPGRNALAEARRADTAGRDADAIRAYENAVAAEPRFVGARVRLAQLLRQSGDAQAALDHATIALERAPGHPEAAVLIASTLIEQNDARGAEILASLLDVNPNHPGALTWRATVARQKGDAAAAANDLRRAMVHSMQDPEASREVALGLSRAGLHDEAVRCARRVLERDQTPRARYTLAFVMEKAERYPESVHEYASLIGDHPEYLPPYRNLGVLMARDGEVARAVLLWERALAFHPDEPSLVANIAAAKHALGVETLGG